MSRKRKQHRDNHEDLPTVENIASALNRLGERLAAEEVSTFRHREQQEPDTERGAEWRGADVRITSDFTWEPRDFGEAHDLLVRTKHSIPLCWLFLEVRDVFSPWLDFRNKYGFYGSLAQAALAHLAANQPEADDPRRLLRSVLDQAFHWLEMLRQEGTIPANAECVLHIQDAEGRQQRIDLKTGEDTP